MPCDDSLKVLKGEAKQKGIRGLSRKKDLCEALGKTQTAFPEHASSYVQNHFDFVQEVGRGNFGIVGHYIDQRTGKNVSIKKIAKAVVGKEEVQMLDLLKMSPKCHANLQCLQEYFRIGESHYIVTSFVGGKSLTEHLKAAHREKFVPGEAFVRLVAVDVLKALDYLHRKGIAHVDVKPDNIVIEGVTDTLAVSKKARCVLIDVGIACITTNPPNFPRCNIRHAGTVVYMSPEILFHVRNYQPVIPYSPLLYKSNDLYGLGLCLYETMEGDATVVWRRFGVLAHGVNQISALIVIASGHKIVSDAPFYERKPRYEKIARALLVQRHTLRPTAKKALKLFRSTSEKVPNLDPRKPLTEYLLGSVPAVTEAAAAEDVDDGGYA